MPTLWAHSHFWNVSGTPSTIADPVAVTGYPAWQTSVILGSGFGASHIIWDWLEARKQARVTTTQEK